LAAFWEKVSCFVCLDREKEKNRFEAILRVEGKLLLVGEKNDMP
jgi:hypothetical protein